MGNEIGLKRFSFISSPVAINEFKIFTSASCADAF